MKCSAAQESRRGNDLEKPKCVLPPKMCPSSCQGNLTKTPSDDSRDASPEIQDTARYVSIHTLKRQIFLKKHVKVLFPPDTTLEFQLLKVTCTLNGNRTETTCQMPVVTHQIHIHATLHLGTL